MISIIPIILIVTILIVTIVAALAIAFLVTVLWCGLRSTSDDCIGLGVHLSTLGNAERRDDSK